MSFVSILLAITFIVPANVDASTFALTVGKYNKATLHSQYLYCYDQQCPGCLYTEYPDIGNPFDTENGDNCEGIHEQLNWYYWKLADLLNSHWVSFAMLTQRETLIDTIEACNQSTDQINCTSEYGPIEGGYKIGSEFELGMLDQQYIDRSRTGDEYPPYDDLGTFRDYCRRVQNEGGVYGSNNWHYATYAAALYLSDAVMAYYDLPTKAARSGVLDVEQAKKLFIHCFVAAQSWEMGSYEYWDEEYILDQVGINPIPFDVNYTPSYYYTIYNAISDIFPVSVTAETESFGTLKAMYGGGGE